MCGSVDHLDSEIVIHSTDMQIKGTGCQAIRKFANNGAHGTSHQQTFAHTLCESIQQ